MKSGADLIRFVRDPRPLAGGRASRFYLVRLTQMNQTTAPNYKWVVLSNTTLGVLIATINSSILLIALPDILRGLNIGSLAAGTSSSLMCLVMCYLVVTAVFVVSFGRLGHMY